jgi:sugar phosphate isomerase/epimerase
MKSRRDFLKISGSLALGSLALQRLPMADDLFKRHKYGLQLFTLFPGMDKDVKGNLQRVKEIGYSEIESAFSMKGGYYGMKPKEFKAMLSDLGLTWRSHHVVGAPLKPNPKFDITKLPKFNTLKNNAQQIVDEVAEGGLKYLVCANYPFETLDELKEGLAVLNKSGELAQKAGIQLVYHNHDMEFKQMEGQVPYDLMLSQVNADLLKMELDLAWATKAGMDPVAMFDKHPGRFPLWHVKDLDKGFINIKPVGEGVIDFKRIFAASKTAGMKHFFVEHDMPEKPFESIASSIKYLKGML